MAKQWEELNNKEKIEELHMAVEGLDAANRAQAVRLSRALSRIADLETASKANEPEA